MNLLQLGRKPPPQPRVVSGVLSEPAVIGMAEARLRRFLALEHHWPKLNDNGRRLVRRAQYSAYIELRRLGEGRRARALIVSAEHARELSK